MSENIMEAMEKRRSIYQLGNKLPIGEEKLQQLVENVVWNAPTAFNSQSSRVVILLNEQQKRLWQIVKDKLQEIVSADKFPDTEKKIDSFAAAYGTILFFEDELVIADLQEKFPLYFQNFPIWSEQASGMLQFAIWTALAEENIGASLQHYNPLIDEEVKNTWQLPENWRLIAQMPFGNIEEPAILKEFKPIDERVLIKK